LPTIAPTAACGNGSVETFMRIQIDGTLHRPAVRTQARASASTAAATTIPTPYSLVSSLTDRPPGLRKIAQ
jgi:hypothetical protein